MKIRHLFMLGAIAAGVCSAEPSAKAVLAGVRCLFPSPHDASRHRLVLQIDVEPDEAGWSVSEAAPMQRIQARDAAGATLTSELCDWEKNPRRADARTVYFSFLLRGKTTWLDIKERLQVQLAEQQRTLRLGEVSMLEPCVLTAENGVEFCCEPAPANADAANLEKDGTLHSAELLIRYPKQVNILRVSRVWKGGADEDTGAEMPPFSQELELLDTMVEKEMKCSRLRLWDANPHEVLEVTTCASQRTVIVPLQFRAMLGDPAPPAESRASAQASAAP